LNDKVKDIPSAIQGVKYIVAEIISDEAGYRKVLRKDR
jgi:transcriptional accessory protein Tex/SPT6